MTRKTFIVAGILCLALVVAMLPFAGACAPKAKPGQVLKIGMMNPTTGPAAEKGSVMTHANLDAIKYINDELGGAGGYTIEVLSLDSTYDATKAVTIVKTFMDGGCLLFTTASSKEMSAAMTSANEAGFPGISCFSSPSLYRPPQHIYGQTPDYGDDALAFANFYMKNIWKGEGKPKFALHMLNNPTGYGARDAFKAKGDELGIEVISMDEHAATTTSEMESLTRIKEKKPDVLYISSTPAPTAVIIKNAKDLGMYPGIAIGCCHAAMTKKLIDLGGADVVEGNIHGSGNQILHRRRRALVRHVHHVDRRKLLELLARHVTRRAVALRAVGELAGRLPGERDQILQRLRFDLRIDHHQRRRGGEEDHRRPNDRLGMYASGLSPDGCGTDDRLSRACHLHPGPGDALRKTGDGDRGCP